MSPFTLVSYGSAKAAKRALLFCGSVQVGQAWWQVASKLVDAGYHVDCPDLPLSLPSHSAASHSAYFLDNLLVPSKGYDLVGGISLGALIAIDISPKLPHPPKRLVLLEPPLGGSFPPPAIDKVTGMINAQKEATNEEFLRGLFPPGTHRRTITAKRMAVLKNTEELVRRGIQDTADATHAVLPPPSDQTEVVIVAADPTKMTMYNIDRNLEAIKEYPHINVLSVPGSAHDVVGEAPDAVVEALLGNKDEWKGSKVLKVHQ